MQCPGSKRNNPNTQAGVHERLIQILPLKGRHAAIFSCLAIENEVRGENGSTDKSTSDEEPLRQVAARDRVCGLICRRRLVATLEAISKSCGFEERLRIRG